MELLPGWENALDGVQPERESRQLDYRLRKSPNYYTPTINFVDTLDKAQDMLLLVQQLPCSHIGFDTEFRYDRPGVVISRKKTRFDPASIHPLLLSLAFVEPFNEGGRIYRFVVDLRVQELVPTLREIFRLPVPFIGHFGKVDLFSIWKLGVPEPQILWDTWVFEKCLNLGRFHPKYKSQNVSDVSEQIRTSEAKKDEVTFNLSLVATCQRYGVSYRMDNKKERLQKSFLTHSDEAPFSEEQIEYSAEDAISACQLYPLQVQKAVQCGLLRHCEAVEMAWVVTNARIEWAGVMIDIKKRKEVVAKICQQKKLLESFIQAEYGINNINSHRQLEEFFKNCGLHRKFFRQKKLTFDKEMLKENKMLHPVIPLLLEARKASDLLADKVLSSEFVGEDGRVRADHQQLGTDTGRQTTSNPNLMGLNRMLRPIVIPESGYGIGEVDWSQVEVGIAAAYYGDDELVRMFNTGDVYSSMAQIFFQDKLTEEDLSLPGREFKEKHKALRNQMKVCTLGILYGITSIGLAPKLGTTKTNASKMQKQFMAMFPQLEDSLAKAAQCGAIRGYAFSVSGLRRHRGTAGESSNWERNWMTNHPVQGSAAEIFKVAGNRLDKLYPQYNARIIIPLHDAFIFEAPLEHLQAVAELTERVMCDTLQEYFPILCPKVEINISRPDCWNKDGDTDELERWIKSHTVPFSNSNVT